MALHVHLAPSADTDQAREILVLAEFALTQGALSRVAFARASGQPRGAAPSTTATIAISNFIFFLNTLPPRLARGQETVMRLQARQLTTLRG